MNIWNATDSSLKTGCSIHIFKRRLQQDFSITKHPLPIHSKQNRDSQGFVDTTSELQNIQKILFYVILMTFSITHRRRKQSR